jgi:hypothetical protein
VLEGLLLYYYKCPYCSSYHLTSQEPKEYDEWFEWR